MSDRDIRNLVNSKSFKVKVTTGNPSYSELKNGIPEYRYIKGKGMYLLLKHNNVVYHQKMSTGGI